MQEKLQQADSIGRARYALAVAAGRGQRDEARDGRLRAQKGMLEAR